MTTIDDVVGRNRMPMAAVMFVVVLGFPLKHKHNLGADIVDYHFIDRAIHFCYILINQIAIHPLWLLIWLARKKCKS